ncbi:MAG: NADH:flavin oxidoreductase [Syntrophobacterales bacterium]|nr:NADH:flavin oxidoreductase [Syntrophobacterales bacterium]
MAKIFEKININGMLLENRTVRSATWEGLADKDGGVTPALSDRMIALARGGVGLIITGHAFITKNGRSGPGQLGVYQDELLPGLTRLATAVHKNSSRIVLQLAHGGFFAMGKLTGEAPLAPSLVPEMAQSPRREMTLPDIQELVGAFAAAAGRAKAAGFDGVQIHAAHGYLLSQFLSPAFNRRTDEYGGSIENRTRFIIEALRAIRLSVGPDYPVLVKMNVGDFIDGGLALDDSLTAASLLAEAGIDAIELSGGFLSGGKLSPSRMGIDSEEKEAYFSEEAKAFRKKVSVPLILIGGTRSFGVAERLIADGIVDCVSFCRPLIREPDLINRWKSGNFAKAACISCNRCFGPGLTGQGVYCVAEKRSA